MQFGRESSDVRGALGSGGGNHFGGLGHFGLNLGHVRRDSGHFCGDSLNFFCDPGDFFGIFGSFQSLLKNLLLVGNFGKDGFLFSKLLLFDKLLVCKLNYLLFCDLLDFIDLFFDLNNVLMSLESNPLILNDV